MVLKEIDTCHDAYAFVEELLHSAFPEEERRPDAAQRNNTDAEARFHCMLIEHDGEVAGLLCWWELSGFRYIEHLAVDVSRRGSGIGAKALKKFLEESRIPVILEVEPASMSEMAERRIAFYRRCGMYIWKTDYMQPPYRRGDKMLPLCLMASVKEPDVEKTSEVIDDIHKTVYGHANGPCSDE